jgi:hypothetical protein
VVSLTLYPNPDDLGLYTVFEYNEETCQSTLRPQYRNGHLTLVISRIYDANGDPASEIVSQADGTVTATAEHSGGLRTLSRHVGPSPAAGLELHDHHNEQQRIDEAGV